MTLEIKKPELEALIENLQKEGANLDEILFDTLNARKATPANARKALASWQAIRGIARGEGSLTEALIEERAAEKKHDEARVQGH